MQWGCINRLLWRVGGETADSEQIPREKDPRFKSFIYSYFPLFTLSILRIINTPARRNTKTGRTERR